MNIYITIIVFVLIGIMVVLTVIANIILFRYIKADKPPEHYYKIKETEKKNIKKER